jgi:hypothetical protein
MLHKTSKMRGFHLHAVDGEIGHVDDFLVDETGWGIRYLVVDTSNWIGGKWVLVSPAVITRVDPEHGLINVSLTRSQVKEGPSIDEADIALVETTSTVWIM